MSAFVRPGSWSELWAIEAPGCTYIAGGCEVVPLLRSAAIEGSLLVDLSALVPAGIDAAETCLRVGAMTRLSELAGSTLVRGTAPGLAAACSAVGSAQVRHMATLGGSLLQRTRCPYFRDSVFACNKRLPGSGCAAREAEYEDRAETGVSPACAAVNASDTAVALLALDATLVLRSPDGVRRMPIGEFYRAPGQSPQYDHHLLTREVVTDVELPLGPEGRQSAFLKLRRRAAFDFAWVSVGVSLRVACGLIEAARIVIGGVGTIPARLFSAEQAVVGRRLARDAIERATHGALSAQQDRPFASMRMTAALTLVTDALLQAGACA
jgi:xanthine dehydrogenase YagS FAD-binding subunit